MQYTTTVTQKGQITIPIAFRQQLDVTSYKKVILKLNSNEETISITAIKDVLDLAGTFTPPANKNKSALAARTAFENNYQRV